MAFFNNLLVHSGRWSVELGYDYSAVSHERAKGDYGEDEHVLREEAEYCLAAAERILDAVRAAHPEEFGDPA